MARTPLFGLLQRAQLAATASRRSGLPLEEFLDRVEAARLSRRRFLRQACGAAGALALAGCGIGSGLVGEGNPPLLPKLLNPDDPVVIVGAGIAGLTAGWRLRQAGVAVRIFEAQERIGGRMHSLRDHFAPGQVCELGGELIDTGHTHIRALAAELGLALDDLLDEPAGIHAEVWFHGGRAYGEREIIEAFLPIAALVERDTAGFGDGDITWRTPLGAAALDALTLSQWLDRNGVSGWLRALIEVAYTTEMGLDPDEQSCLNFLTFVGTGTERFQVFGESDERFHVRGGNDLVPRALAAKLADAIETGSVLEQLGQDAAGRYALAFRRGSATTEVKAARVLLAIPFTTLRQVRLDLDLPPQKRRAIAELRYGTNAKLMIGFDERVWRTRHNASGSVFSTLPFQTTWETSRAQPGSSGILTNFTGGRHGLALGRGNAREQAELTVTQLEAVFPGARVARGGGREVRFHWPSNPWVQGSYACLGPGQFTTLRGVMGERVGKLHFAGEHCALDSQGYMEGGCESGTLAAAEIVAALGLATAARAVPARRQLFAAFAA